MHCGKLEDFMFRMDELIFLVGNKRIPPDLRKSLIKEVKKIHAAVTGRMIRINACERQRKRRCGNL